MKILFIGSRKFDYLQDLIYSGLVKVVGIENVKTYPYNWSFHLKLRKYPKNQGFSGGFLSSIKNRLGFKYDCVIVGSCKVDTFQTYIDILPELKDVPVVFLDGGDRPEVGGDLDRKGFFELFERVLKMRNFDLVFKREKLLSSHYAPNVFPCPFPFNINRIATVDYGMSKKYDVTFWAVESDIIRTKALNLIQNKYDCKSNGTTLNQEFKKYNRKGDYYLEELSRSKIVLNFRGGGWDTMRYWETPAMSTFLISQRPGIEIMYPFESGVNIVYINDDLSDLQATIDYYLSQEEEREDIAINAKAHLLKYHTDELRAKYILNKITSL